MIYLEIAAHLSAIATFLIAAGGYFIYRYDSIKKRKRLENYLQKSSTRESDSGQGKKGQHTVIHLMKEVGLTEAEILQASFQSKNIRRYSIVDKQTNRAIGLLFAYHK